MIPGMNSSKRCLYEESLTIGKQSRQRLGAGERELVMERKVMYE